MDHIPLLISILLARATSRGLKLISAAQQPAHTRTTSEVEHD
jgi:hypothetical protein